MSIVEKNAIITRAELSVADHGVLVAWLDLDYGDSGQAFGGTTLHIKSSPGDGYFAGHYIWRCMDIGGVTEWSRLPGKTIRVRADHSKVHQIGHIVKDDWFDPMDDLYKLQKVRREASE